MPLTNDQKNNCLGWCELLKSGKYTQCEDALRGLGNSRCCLGVALEYFKNKTGKGEWCKRKEILSDEFQLGVYTASGNLSEFKEVCDFYGFPYHGLGFLIKDHHLTNYNDGNKCSKKSFEEIAAMVEQYVKEN